MNARTFVWLTVTVMAGVAILTAVALMLGHTYSWTVGPVHIRITSLDKALTAAWLFVGIALPAGWSRRFSRRIGTLLIVATFLLTVVAVARGAQEIAGAGDMAVIESYTIDTVRSHLLLGPYSRFMWHHPGPLYFYFLAPFYVLSGYKATGLAAGALILNVMSLVAIGWVALRIAGATSALIITGVCVLYTIQFHEILASPWNPHVIVLPTMAVIILSAAVASGSVRLLPAAAVLSTLIVQTHLGVAPVALAISGCAMIAAAGRVLVAGDTADRLRLRQVLSRSSWVLALLWFPPLLEQLTHTPGNLSMLWRFFRSNSERQPLLMAAAAWADATTGWLRHGLVVPLGVRYVSHPTGSIALLAAAQVVVLGIIAIRLARRHQQFVAAMAVMVLVALLVTLWSVTHIAGEIVDHEVFWMSCLGPLVAAVLVDALIAWRLPSRVSLAPWAARIGVATLLLVAASYGVAELRLAVQRSYRPLDDEIAAQTIADEVRNDVQAGSGRKPMISIDPPAWEVAAGVITALQKAGVRVAVEPGTVWMFTDVFAPTGEETEIVVVCREAMHRDLVERPGTRAIAARRGFFADIVPLGSVRK